MNNNDTSINLVNLALNALERATREAEVRYKFSPVLEALQFSLCKTPLPKAPDNNQNEMEEN